MPHSVLLDTCCRHRSVFGRPDSPGRSTAVYVILPERIKSQLGVGLQSQVTSCVFTGPCKMLGMKSFLLVSIALMLILPDVEIGTAAKVNVAGLSAKDRQDCIQVVKCCLFRGGFKCRAPTPCACEDRGGAVLDEDVSNCPRECWCKIGDEAGICCRRVSARFLCQAIIKHAYSGQARCEHAGAGALGAGIIFDLNVHKCVESSLSCLVEWNRNNRATRACSIGCLLWGLQMSDVRFRLGSSAPLLKTLIAWVVIEITQFISLKLKYCAMLNPVVFNRILRNQKTVIAHTCQSFIIHAGSSARREKIPPISETAEGYPISPWGYGRTWNSIFPL